MQELTAYIFSRIHLVTSCHSNKPSSLHSSNEVENPDSMSNTVSLDDRLSALTFFSMVSVPVYSSVKMACK